MQDAAVSESPGHSSEKATEVTKLPYQPPTLTVYGNIATITANVGPYGRLDNRRGGRRTGFDQGNGNYNG